MLKSLSVYNTTKKKIDKRKVHNLIRNLKNDIKFDITALAVNFLSDDQILLLNKSYLGHNYSTDIITFNYSGENYTLDGEIFISLGDAAYNAEKYKVSLENELVRLIIHGLLHLVGYDDKFPDDKRKMKKIENKLVKKYLNSLT